MFSGRLVNRKTVPLAIVLVALCPLAFGPPVNALVEMPRPFEPDSSLQRDDSIPPLPVALRVYGVYRGTGPLALNDSVQVEDSEGEHASIALTVVGSETGGYPPRLGFRYHLVDGTLPEGLMSLPIGAWCPLTATDKGKAMLAVSWIESRSFSHDAFCFRMYVTAVDSAGNESPPSNTVAVWHDGNQDIDKARLRIMMNHLEERTNASREIMGEWRGVDREGRGLTLTLDYRTFVLVATDTLRGSLDWEFNDIDKKTGLLDLSAFDLLHECVARHGIFQREGAVLRVCLGAPGAARPRDFDNRQPGADAYEFRRPK